MIALFLLNYPINSISLAMSVSVIAVLLEQLLENAIVFVLVIFLSSRSLIS